MFISFIYLLIKVKLKLCEEFVEVFIRSILLTKFCFSLQLLANSYNTINYMLDKIHLS